MIFLGLFIFFIFLVAYYRKKGIRQQEALENEFWNRENEANHTRRQDISGLPYITIPLEKFTMDICDSPELKALESTLTELSTKKILNLSNQTNTDLKLKYGVANLDELSAYDQNFSTLCGTLVSYAECLSKLGYPRQAQTVLEFGISCGSDHSRNYRMLADMYAQQNQYQKLQELLASANELNSPMKHTIVSHIEEKLASLT